MKDLNDRLQMRAKHIEDARAILKKAEDESRGLNTEERSQYEKLHEQAKEIKQEVDDERQQRDAEAQLAVQQDADDRANAETREDSEQTLEERQLAGFLAEFVTGVGNDESRALQSDSDEAGGYLRPPQQFVASLIRAVDDMVWIRQLATTQTVISADSLGAPSLDADPADPTWTSELSIGSEDTTMDFGKRELHPHPLAQFIKVSNKLMRQVTSVESLVRGRLSYKQATVQENAFLNGTGAMQPLGVFVASDDGISTSRDVSEDNTATLITFDGLKNAKWALKPQYRNVASWLFHTDALKQIDKLKDGEGRYIWQPSVQVGAPDRVLNLPTRESQFAPNTFTSGLYVGILADWKKYWIADALSVTIQRLVELYAATNQTGYISRSETDGMPVLEEAFVRVTLG